MQLKRLEIGGFKSFAKKSVFDFNTPISAIVGPNGSGKSNVVEAVRFVLGEQSLKSLRGKRGEDLIFNGSKSLARLNHAKVSIAFDNTKRELNLDYDEVVISREVNRDSSSEYFINGTAVRLRDIIELLAGVHIGASGHHIISQGEADRILNSSSRDRKSMIEEALGLKIYHWKIAESDKKLAKTEENLKEAESLRRELAPHIKFLKKQVEKIEQARAYRDELLKLYHEYLKREEEYLSQARSAIKEERRIPEEELKRLGDEHARLQESIRSKETGDSDSVRKLKTIEEKLAEVRRKRDDLTRKEGRLDGMIEYQEDVLRKKAERASRDEQAPVDRNLVNEFTGSLEKHIAEAETFGDFSVAQAIFKKLRELIATFISKSRQGVTQEGEDGQAEVETLKNNREETHRLLQDAVNEEKKLSEEYAFARNEIEKEKDSSRDAEMALFDIRAKKSEFTSKLATVDVKEENLLREEESFRRELEEAKVLSGDGVLAYKDFAIDGEAAHSEERSAQEDRRKRIEKIKIRLEDMGSGTGEDVVKEHDQTIARDEFLAKEIEDLQKSAEALSQLITDLTIRLGEEFQGGIKKINKQFEEFFALMFGGGTATLLLIKEQKRRRAVDPELEGLEVGEDEGEVEEEEGIDINISLPHKKIKGLHMLSGGERALTSIALLFAISQVNPPPFLILDETDAALDEANSKKYGNMLENLSKYSQLIVVTHNRETMSRAGILYGVTMGSDAVSKLLSVKFEEAVAIAK
ncbi:MAG: AAA family ATPase [Candidatus Yonathbacteria bacterium]|nr:AAA family ATPase [Candidatus Yonathbacteria bacterium]